MKKKEFRKLLKTTGKYVNILADNGITNVRELLHYFPRAYEDRTTIKTLSEVDPEADTETVKAKVTDKNLIRTPRGRKLTTITIEDENGVTGKVQGLHSTYLLRQVTKNKRFYFVGKPQLDGNKVTFRHPDVMPAKTDQKTGFNYGRIYPVYSELQGIKPHWFAKKIYKIIHDHGIPEIEETLPASFRDKYDLVSNEEMIRMLHDPQTLDEVDKAKYRLFFERLLRMQLVSLINKKDYQARKDTEQPDWELIREFLDTLPFELTRAQKKALKEIIDDFHSGTSMMRLMQGDVGSGKTVVATAAARYSIKKFQGQVAFIAPIEVLAVQHYKTLAKFLLPLGIRIELLTGGTKPKEKARIKKGLAQGHIDFVVGTHALIQDDIDFPNLEFAIVDEQHKFGVKQRAFFQQFDSPHLLQMTATPIPRSLALAFFGEFQVSNIDEMPAGRKPITTKIVSESELNKLKPRIVTKIDKGEKVFMITPLIEESDSEMMEEIANAKETYVEIEDHYPELKGRIGLLHGKMKSEDKQRVMQEFKEGKTVFLVSTTVIEVGIDIPEATVMIIKNAERFGLSQLHQLRGRVGRSDLQSYCFIHTPKKSGEAYKRLQHLEATNDGFKLAEIDLELRGSGEILGLKQSGATDIPLSVLNDTAFLEKVQEAAERLLNNEPDFTKEHFLSSDLQEKMDSLLV